MWSKDPPCGGRPLWNEWDSGVAVPPSGFKSRGEEGKKGKNLTERLNPVNSLHPFFFFVK